MKNMWMATLWMVLVARAAAGGETEPQASGKVEKYNAARRQGLAWLAGSQRPDGSWGNQYRAAVTGLVCLAHLASADEPFRGERGLSLVRGLQYLLAVQKDGSFPREGHTWIHGQGFRHAGPERGLRPVAPLQGPPRHGHG